VAENGHTVVPILDVYRQMNIRQCWLQPRSGTCCLDVAYKVDVMMLPTMIEHFSLSQSISWSLREALLH
jgi:hypothetical protein